MRAHRLSHNLTQAELASDLGCSQEMVAEIEAGTKEPGGKLNSVISRILAGTSNGHASRGAYGRKRAGRSASTTVRSATSTPTARR